MPPGALHGEAQGCVCRVLLRQVAWAATRLGAPAEGDWPHLATPGTGRMKRRTLRVRHLAPGTWPWARSSHWWPWGPHFSTLSISSHLQGCGPHPNLLPDAGLRPVLEALGATEGTDCREEQLTEAPQSPGAGRFPARVPAHRIRGTHTSRRPAHPSISHQRLPCPYSCHRWQPVTCPCSTRYL